MVEPRRNPWAVPAPPNSIGAWRARRNRKLHWVVMAAAVATGIAIGALLPLDRLRPGPEAETGPTSAPTLPETAAPSRRDSPLPLPPVLPEMPRSEGARVAGFGFCTGRAGDNCVIDGDSFNFRGETVRLAGIDTPEIGGAKCADERARGEAAERRLHALLNAGEVKLVRVGGRDRDRFGRLLRDAEVNGVSVSGQLMAEGHARGWTGSREPWC